MHAHSQIARAAKAALDLVPELAGHGTLFRVRPAERERMPAWSVYVARSRNRISHDHDGVTPAVERDIELAIVVWIGVSADLDGEVSRLMALIEPALCGAAALKALAADGLVYPQSFDVEMDREDRGFAIATMIYRLGAMTPVDDPETILT